MKNLKDLFVSYEIALQLKESGFNEDSLGFYNTDKHFFFAHKGNCLGADEYSKNNEIPKDYGIFTAPMYAQVIDWLREEKGIQVFVDYFYYDGFHYNYKWVKSNGEYGQDWKDNGEECKGWDTPHGALTCGIEEVLKLI